MPKQLSKSILACAALAGGLAAAAPPDERAPMAPREAIMAAADAAPRPVFGTYAMQVAAAARVGSRVYLNSEADYRDQRNLTIAIAPRTARLLAERYGAAPERYFRGRRIEVRGPARRMRINFIDSRGRATGLYYYQTHVQVTNPDQLAIVR